MYKLFSILSVLIIISMLPAVLSAGTINPNQPDTGDTIPSWIKNTAGWWADELIDDSSFVFSIQWLITNDIIILSPTEQGIGGDDIVIPSWIKSTAGWWADDKIHDVVFVGAIRYLINEGIMVVMEPQVEVAKCNFKGKEVVCSSIEKEVVEINDFYMEVNGGSCSYCVNWSYVGDEYYLQIETYDEQHGKYIDGVKITAKIISKGGELRHDFGEVITDDGVYKNSIAIPSMDWYAENILSVTGEYFGVEKTIEKEFEVFRGQGDQGSGSRSYGAGAGDCALVGPVSVNDNSEDETNPHGITFSKSGMTMYMVGNADKVFGYNLANAYCIASTRSDDFAIEIKDISTTGSGNPTGIVFDPSGTKLFLVDKNSDKVYQYVVNAPWRVTAINATAGDSNHCHCNPISLSISDQEANPEGITFDNTGTKMFVVGSEGTNKGEVNTYNLSVPYLVSSASHASVYTMSFTDANPSGITFDNSGTKMFISDQGTDTIRAYVLKVPYITSSNSTGDATQGYDEDGDPRRCSSFCGEFLSMTDVGGSVRDIWFDASGTKLFILEQGGRDVTVYELTVPFALSSAKIVS